MRITENELNIQFEELARLMRKTKVWVLEKIPKYLPAVDAYRVMDVETREYPLGDTRRPIGEMWRTMNFTVRAIRMLQ